MCRAKTFHPCLFGVKGEVVLFHLTRSLLTLFHFRAKAFARWTVITFLLLHGRLAGHYVRQVLLPGLEEGLTDRSPNPHAPADPLVRGGARG
jgi:hypothetical protein